MKVLVIILLFVTISYPKAEEKAPEDLKLEGNIYFISNNYEKAVSAFIECYNLDSNFFNDYIELGKSYFYLKKYDDALHWYNKAIEKNPTNGLYWSGKASILVQLTKYDEAILCYNKSIELDPPLCIFLYDIAVLYSKLNDKTNLLEHLSKAIDIDSSFKQKARGDKDFKSYWDDPDFIELTKE